MKLKLSFKKLSSFKFSNLGAHVGAILWVFVGVMALLVGWVVVSEVNKVKGLTTDYTAAQNQTVRVNTEKYKQLEERLDANRHFEPKQIPKADVFGAPPAPAPQ